MASITSLGVGSGLDLDSLVTKLVSAERTPVENRLDLRETEVQASISAFGALKSSLSALQSALGGLKDLNDFSARNAISSDTDIFTATADETAVVGDTDINVLNLSATHKLASADFSSPDAVVGTGTLTISNTTGKAITVNIATGTLTDIKNSINNEPNNDIVSASIITVDDGVGGTVSKLVFTAKESGLDNALEVVVVDDDGFHDDASGLSQLYYEDANPNNRLTSITNADDARITVDGFTASSSTNIFENVIGGVTITAIGETEDPINDPPSVLTISLNKSVVETKINAFITEYNSFAEILNTLGSFNAATGEGGLLNGDSTLRTIQNQIRRAVFGSVPDLSGTINTLSELGITTNDQNQLELNTAQLDEVITNNFDEIGALFTSDKGIGTQLDALLTQILASNGTIKARQDGNDAILKDIANQRENLEQRVADVELRFRRQFASLDILIGQLNSTSNFLSQQLDNANKLANRNNNRN